MQLMFLQHADPPLRKMETAQHAAETPWQHQQDVKENWYGHARPTEGNS